MATRNLATQQHRSFRTLLLAVSIEPTEIGERIKAARERKGWTQLAFAREANVSPSSVQRWEAGGLPPIRELIRLAGVLGVATDELVEQTEEPHSLAEIQKELADEVARLREVTELLEAQLREPAHPRRAGKRA